jgi:hypothetical protein
LPDGPAVQGEGKHWKDGWTLLVVASLPARRGRVGRPG